MELYRGLWQIEESFKITKDCLDSRPVHVERKSHIEAHFLTCFVTLLIGRILQMKTGGAHSVHAIVESLLPVFTRIYTYLAENADLCAVFLGENGDIAFVEKIKGLIRGTCFRTWAARYPDVDPKQFEEFYAFVVGGHIGLIQNWISTGMQESPEEIAALAEDMVLRGAGCLQKR